MPEGCDSCGRRAVLLTQYRSAFGVGLVVTDIVKIWRRLAHEQALASTRIEGHRPSAEFLSDCEAVIKGAMTRGQARAASLQRALSKERATAAALTRGDR
nr:hypothetical protein [Rubrivivax gelatinosus]